MNSLVTGTSGFVGSALVSRLSKNGHRVVPLQRTPGNGSEVGPNWNPAVGQIYIEPSGALDAVVHVAGENIAQRWTPAVKARIRASRVDATRLLCEALARLPQPPRVLVCASATGFYGDRGEEVLDERSAPGTGFLPEVCQAWEAAADAAQQRGIRVVHLRLGIVLARHGGALAKMLPSFRFGLGGRLDVGRQFWSWIALEDLLRVVELALQDDRLSGAVNEVSPEPVTNTGFTRTLARALHRPAVLSPPAWVRACSQARMQNSASIVLLNSHANTYRLHQSITATRCINPCAIGMYVMSMHHTWFGPLISSPFNRYGNISCPSPGWLNEPRG
jgi:hypothetical protein